MIEKIILSYLSNALTVPVYLEEPISKDNEYVIIEKTGSGKENYLSSATLAIQSYSTSMSTVIELNEKVKKAMEEMDIPEVCSCYLNSDYNWTDPETNRYRYQAVFDIYHY